MYRPDDVTEVPVLCALMPNEKILEAKICNHGYGKEHGSNNPNNPEFVWA
jgi:hypothetical protein